VSAPTAATPGEPLVTSEWCAHHFDHLSPQMGTDLHEALDLMRAEHPVTWSDAWGGFWVVTRYADVLAVAQDWETYSSAQGVTVPWGPSKYPAIPEMIDPPEHRVFKRLINAYLTPSVVGQWEDATRAIVTRLIDAFVETGRCDFMADFARPLPGLAFFDLVLHAPSDELAEVNRLSTAASIPTAPGAMEARETMLEWISGFVEARRAAAPRDDVVDAILHADIDGRPVTHEEIVGVIQLLLFGGLDTTAGALGMTMVRFCEVPAIPATLRADPSRVPEAAEELLRLDSPFVFIARTATRDTELGGQRIAKGDKVLVSWASANRDDEAFACPASFDIDRATNRHLAFGAGPHRCAGSNLARMNIRVALEEILARLTDIRLDEAAGPVTYHSGFSRTPAAVPITFTPGPRVG
jgi:cytochrome P450